MIKSKGVFVTIEGPNGVGKSTIISEVKSKLGELGFDVVVTKEPTESELGTFIRNSEELYSGNTLACLVAADRYYHIETQVMPHLNDGKIVISDRYIESSLVLQRLDNVNLDFIWGLNSEIIVPDLSVVLMASSETLESGLSQREKLTKFERVRTRQEEVELYGQAVDILRGKGFNVVVVENEESAVGVNASLIVNQVLDNVSKFNFNYRREDK